MLTGRLVAARGGHATSKQRIGSGREGEEAGGDSVHPKAAHDSQCDGEKQNAVAGDRHSARLIVKTVAGPSYSYCRGQENTPGTFYLFGLRSSFLQLGAARIL